MALTLEEANLTKQRARSDTRSPAASLALKALFMHLAQNRANPKLQFTVISGLESADKVASDSACRVYAVYAKKPTASTVDSWLKASDHATVAATAPDWAEKLIGTSGGGQEHANVFLDGLLMGTGFTLGAHTANNGNSKSLVADAPTGFAIVGAV
jgi:hypothetical protein